MTQPICPHCKRQLTEFLDLGDEKLFQCPDDSTVHSFAESHATNAEPDETLAKLACPTGNCD